MELGKEGAVRDVIEAVNGDTVTLDEILHHIDVGQVFATVHRIEDVLPGLREVLLCHLPDRLRLVDDVVLAQSLVPAVDGEVGPHHHTADESLLFVRHGVHLHLADVVEGLEVRHHGRIVHQGDLHHPGLLVSDESIKYGYSPNSDHSFSSLLSGIYRFAENRKIPLKR